MPLFVSFGMPELRAELVQDEGRRDKPYRDTLGNLIFGIGHLVTGREHKPLNIDALFIEDVTRAVNALDRVLPWWRTLPPPHQRVMVNLTFNMGIGRFVEFRDFLAAMQKRDWDAASMALVGSRWWTQVGNRGPRMTRRLRSS